MGNYVLQILVLLIGSFIICVVMRRIAIILREMDEPKSEIQSPIYEEEQSNDFSLIKNLRYQINNYKKENSELKEAIKKERDTEDFINTLIKNSNGIDSALIGLSNKLILAILLEGVIFNKILNIYNVLDTSNCNTDCINGIIQKLHENTRLLINHLQKCNISDKDIIDAMKHIADKFNSKHYQVTLYVPGYNADIYSNPYLRTKKNSAIVSKILSVAILHDKKIVYQAIVE